MSGRSFHVLLNCASPPFQVCTLYSLSILCTGDYVVTRSGGGSLPCVVRVNMTTGCVECQCWQWHKRFLCVHISTVVRELVLAHLPPALSPQYFEEDHQEAFAEQVWLEACKLRLCCQWCRYYRTRSSPISPACLSLVFRPSKQFCAMIRGTAWRCSSRAGGRPWIPMGLCPPPVGRVAAGNPSCHRGGPSSEGVACASNACEWGT